jgi:hypothetical protein
VFCAVAPLRLQMRLHTPPASALALVLLLSTSLVLATGSTRSADAATVPAAAATAPVGEEFDYSAPIDVSTRPVEYVQIVHRHGDRAPVSVMPSQAARWEAKRIGPGQLSRTGVKQLRAFGRAPAAAAGGSSSGSSSGLLDAAYNHHQLRVRSTSVERCLMSVDSALDILFPDHPVRRMCGWGGAMGSVARS